MSTQIKTRQAFYGKALARVHAESYGNTFLAGFDWLAAQIKQAPGPARVFDLGCGDGSWLAAAKNMSIAGEGVDISSEFVSLAKGKGLNVRHESVALAHPPVGTNAVTALGEVLAYAPAALTPCVLNVGRALPKGGVFIFDLPGPETPTSQRDFQGVDSQGADWNMRIRNRIGDHKLTRTIQLETKVGLVEEVHEQHLFSPDEVEDILHGFGFRVEILASYGPCPLLPGRFGVLAHKS